MEWYLATLLSLIVLSPGVAEAQHKRRMTVEQVVDRALNDGLEIAENQAAISSARFGPGRPIMSARSC